MITEKMVQQQIYNEYTDHERMFFRFIKTNITVFKEKKIMIRYTNIIQKAT